MTLAKQGFTLVAVPLVCELAFGGLLAAALLDAEKEIDKCVRSAELLQASNKLQKQVLELRPAIISFLDTGGEADKQLDEALKELNLDLDSVQKLAPQDPELPQLRSSVSALLDAITKSRNAYKQGYSFEGFGVRGLTMQTIMNTTKFTQTLIEKQHFTIIESAKAQSAQRQSLKTLFVSGVALNIIIALVLAAYFSRGTAARLRILMDNTNRFARGDELNPPIAGKDEISTLDKFFNSMASKLIETREKEKELQKLKQDFVAMISHDLRTPLTALQCTLQLIAEGKYGEQSPESLKWLATSDNNIRRMVMLITSLLDVEKMESGKIDLTPAQTSSQSIITKSIAVVAGQAQKKKIEFKVNDDNITLTADQERLIQVLVNLLGNALKFSKPGDTITIYSRESEDLVEIGVTDTGPGISSENKSLVFDRFKQLSKDDAQVHGGSGLGLYICKAIVEQHGGTIGVDSTLGKGSTFWFKIPQQESAALSVQEKQTTAS